jgi:hypothetical protein
MHKLLILFELFKVDEIAGHLLGRHLIQQPTKHALQQGAVLAAA